MLDATCGNGYDTELLTSLVGAKGRVIGMDIQEEAIVATRTRLVEAGLVDRCSLHCMSHAFVGDVLGEGTGLACAVFNLGYLPGSDKSVITRPQSSGRAHEAVIDRLSPGGVVFTTMYTGHEGGQDEAEGLLAWSRQLPPTHFSVARHEWINQKGHPPGILVITRRAKR